MMLAISAAISNASVLELSWNGARNGTGTNMAVTLNPSGTATIDVYCSGQPDNPRMGWHLAVLGPGSIEGVGTLYVPPSPAGTVQDWYTYQETYWYSEYLAFRVAADTRPSTTGTYWDAEFHCDGPGVATILLFDPYTLDLLDTITVTEVPEPMTAGLLGLGGVFLRRRRKNASTPK